MIQTPPTDVASYPDWLKSVALFLVQNARLKIGDETFRFMEVEAYYNSPEHPDPFTHNDPIQGMWGAWYFHRTAGKLRSGSFKGLDLAIGNEPARGGILIRGIASDTRQIDGPSLSVDTMMQKAGYDSLSKLSKKVSGLTAWDESNPLQLITGEAVAPEPLFCPRVGLTLKKAKAGSSHFQYIGRHYRLLAEPAKTAKGRLHAIVALHYQGKTIEEISAATGSPKGSVKKTVDSYNTHTTLDADSLVGVELSTTQLAQLFGWTAAQGWH